MNIVILEPDRIIAKLIKNKLVAKNIKSNIAPTPEIAMQLIDNDAPSAIISELSLSGHSALEFFYELRSYPDLQNIPIYLYTSLSVDDTVMQSKDWSLLAIKRVYYKPQVAIDAVIDGIVLDLSQ